MAAALDQFCGATNLKVGAARHRAVRLRAAAVDVGHVGGRHQPVGHHHRHQPHGRPGPVAGPRSWPSSTGVADLADKADGVLYTSDGRDVEMSVASTKAFYSQVAAGLLLAASISDEVGGRVARPCSALRDLPDAMAEVIDRRPAIAEAAHGLAPAKRYWAVVGNGSTASPRPRCGSSCRSSATSR